MAWEGNRNPYDDDFTTSDIATVATTITLPDLRPTQTHYFAGVEFFSDADGTPATPSAGTVTVTVITAVNPQVAESITNGEIDATAPTTVDWASPTSSAIFTPDSIAAATHWRVNVSGHKR